jgi:hypothetical protein
MVIARSFETTVIEGRFTHGSCAPVKTGGLPDRLCFVLLGLTARRPRDIQKVVINNPASGFEAGQLFSVSRSIRPVPQDRIRRPNRGVRRRGYGA